MEEEILPENDSAVKKGWKITIEVRYILYIGIALLTLFILVGVYFFTKFYIQKKTITKIAPLSAKQLSGQILFRNKQGLQILNVKSGEVAFGFPGGVMYNWLYQNNNYVFTSSSSAVVRFSLSTHQEDAMSLPNIGSIRINPSPDGQKAYVIDAPGYPGDPTPPIEFIYDYTTQKKIYLPDGEGLYKWLPDSKHVILASYFKGQVFDLPDGTSNPSMKLVIYNLASGQQTFLFEGLVGSFVTSENGDTLLWYSNTIGPNFQITRERAKPILYHAHFDLLSETLSPVATISASAFPIHLDTYYNGAVVAAGNAENTFFMTVGDKDTGIYEVDTNTSQIKKITPEGSYSYYFVAYNRILKKVLAYKYPDKMYPLNFPPSQVRTYKYKPQIVLLDVSGKISETVITRLEGLLPNMQFVFSPDNKFILGPKYSDQFNDKEFTIYSLQKPFASLDLNLGQIFSFDWMR